ncbi:MAG: HD domain-containing protein [Caldisericia bacterium]|nr:HD domain-containing protein [Caldisericia bacterium]
MNIKEKIQKEIEVLTNLIEELIKGKEKNEDKILNLISFQTIIRGINQIILRIKNEDELFQGVVDLLLTQNNIVHAYIGILKDQEIKSYSKSKYKEFEEYVKISKESEAFEPFKTGEIKKISLNKNGVKELISLPISDEKQKVGVLTLSSNKEGFFDEEEINFLKEVSQDILVGLRTLNYQKEIKTSLLNLAMGIKKIVELRDPSTKNHGDFVAKASYEIGKRLGFEEEKLDMLYIAGLIHDIGKISIAMEILNKPFKLREVEYEWVKQHTYYGYEYLRDLNFPLPIAEIIYQHHERIDGSGYPRGLKGDEIMIEAKIIAVLEVFHAMISHKPYRPPHSVEETLNYLKENRGILFDEKVVDTFFEVINEGFLNRC